MIDLAAAAANAPPPRRRLPRWLGVALAATLVATAVVAWQDEGGPSPPPRRERPLPGAAHLGAARSPIVASASPNWPDRPAPRADAPAAVEGRAWNAVVLAASAPELARAVPAAPAPAAAASAIVAPSFGYVLIGRIDDGQPQALLSGPLRSLAVRAGDVVDGQWRVDAVQPDHVRLTWLPGSQPLRLAFRPS